MPEATEVAEVAETPETRAAGAAATLEAKEADDNTLLGAEGDESEGSEESGEAESAELKAPENYEFKVPEGMSLNNEVLEKFIPIFKEADLSQEVAQKLVDVYAPIQQQLAEASRQAAIKDYENMSEDWKRQTIKEHGADYKKAMAPAAKLIEKTGFGNEIRELLQETRLGNHPTMVKFLVWLGKGMSEDSFVDANQSPVGGLTSIYDHPTSKATLK